MKRLKNLLFTLIIIVLSNPLFASETLKKSDNLAFGLGEKVSYKIKYNLYFNINVGQVDFELKDETKLINGFPCYHAVAKGKTFSFYDAFFKVRDVYQTYMETASLLPLVALRDVSEGGFKFTENVYFNHKDKKVKTPKGIKSIGNNTFDVLSLLYYTRNADFSNAKEGDRMMLNMFIDDSSYTVGFKYIKRETIKTEAGKFKCIKIQPILIQGRVFKSEEQMVLWITDDDNHIPVRIESGISVGAIKADLISYSNLKHTMVSKLK